MDDLPSGDMTYTMLKAGGQEVAGMVTTPPEEATSMPTMSGSYVTVEAVDAQAGKAETLGGKVLAPPCR
ncbi:MAG TPA: hypothetical protein ENI94_12395 [Gammaproteobacteria bacterium]|nr:hypothetical protein [Gammaproteobacteria bacterium]